MRVDYEKVFRAFQKYIDRTFCEMLQSDTLRKELEGYYSKEDRTAAAFMENIDARRKIVEGYYLSGSVTEERFLDVCCDIDNDLYDDYKDMYEQGHVLWGIPLEKYILDLQRITGKRPVAVRRWCHLRVLSKSNPAPDPPEDLW